MYLQMRTMSSRVAKSAKSLYQQSLWEVILLGGVDNQLLQISLPLLVIGNISRQMRTGVGTMDMITIDNVQELVHISEEGTREAARRQGGSQSLRKGGNQRGCRIHRGQGRRCCWQAIHGRIQGILCNCCLRGQLISWANIEGDICTEGMVTAVVVADSGLA